MKRCQLEKDQNHTCFDTAGCRVNSEADSKKKKKKTDKFSTAASYLQYLNPLVASLGHKCL